jgi:hypothetical protein
MAQPLSYFYVTGGTLRPGCAELCGAAGSDLFDTLLKKEFCYVLTSRQMGKSSLMVRTAHSVARPGN